MTVYYAEVATSDKTSVGTDLYIKIKIHGDTGVTTELVAHTYHFKKGAWVEFVILVYKKDTCIFLCLPAFPYIFHDCKLVLRSSVKLQWRKSSIYIYPIFFKLKVTEFAVI